MAAFEHLRIAVRSHLVCQSRDMATDQEISAHLQARLTQEGLSEVAAVAAARWLDDAHLLRDSASRRGLPLRNRLRDGRVAHAELRRVGGADRWFILRADRRVPDADVIFDALRALPDWQRAPRTAEARRDRTWLFWPAGVPGCRWGVFVNTNGLGAQLTIELPSGEAEDNKRVLATLRAATDGRDPFDWRQDDATVRTRVRLGVDLAGETGAEQLAALLLAAVTQLQEQLGESLAEALEVLPALTDAEAFVEQAARPRRQGRGLSSDERRAVELRAVDAATAVLHEEGWAVEDVGARRSYDLDCVRGREHLVVEVKGTTGGLDTIVLTANEVRIAAAHFPRTALFVLYDISLSRGGAGPVASGGTPYVVRPWRPEDDRLTPTVFSYRLSDA